MNENTKYGVQSAAFHEAIHVGRLNKGNTEFLDKEDATDMVLFAVSQYVLSHFDGGLMSEFRSTRLDHKLVLNISVEEHRLSTDENDV